MIHGDDIYVTMDIDGTQKPIAAAKSGDLDVSQDFIKACSPTDGRTFIKIPTTYDWGVSCDCLMTTTDHAYRFISAVRNGTKYTLQFIVGGFKLKGDVYVKSAKITATKGSLAKLAISFESSGPLLDGTGWDFINGTLYTYSNFADGTLDSEGIFTEDQQTPTNNKLEPPTASES